AAYADAPSSTQEPDVGPEPLLERLIVAHGGDVQAAVESEDFASTVAQLTTGADVPDERVFASNVTNLARQEVAKTVIPSPTPGVSQSAGSAIDKQAAASMEHVMKGRPPGGPKVSLR